MQQIKFLFILFLILSFLAGGYFYIFQNGLAVKEYFENDEHKNTGEKSETSTCPDLLIRSGSTLLLINTKMPRSDTNPLPFFSLDEYINYLEIQKKKGIQCPVLFLQEETNTQGHNVYRVRSSPFSHEGAIPETTNIYNNPNSPFPIIDANRQNEPYNKNNYAGFDPTGLYVGRYTVLDKIHDSTEMAPISDNPMDSNWGGVVYTHNVVKSGKYTENEVVPPTLYQTAIFAEKSDNIRNQAKSDNIYA
jgi:hypothetical protein